MLSKVILALLVAPSLYAGEVLIKGKPVVCSYNHYNCPSNGSWKALSNCKEVEIVKAACKGDPHGLDADNDGHFCERDCTN